MIGFICLIFLGLSVGLDSWIYTKHSNLLWAAGGISFMFITNQQFERTEVLVMVFSCGADLHSKRFYPLIIVKYCSPLFRFDFGQLGKTVMLDAILGSKGDVGLLERTDSTIYNTL